LLDLGFERDLTAIIQTLNSRSAKVPVAGKSENGDHKDEEEEIKPNEHKSRQTVLCSATLNKVRQIRLFCQLIARTNVFSLGCR
jgi:superfamily II DNA/RNA helicase